MTIDVFAYFQSLGDNCELGLVQRRCGVNEAGLFRFARTTNIEDLISILDARLEGLLAEDQLAPRDHVMVEDRRFRIHFHTDAVSTLQRDGSWLCSLPEDKQRQIFARERARAAYCAAKTMKHLTDGTRLFVYKCNDTPTMVDVEALLERLRRFGDNYLLFARLDEDPEKDGAVEQVAPFLYEGLMNAFADYGDVNAQLHINSWQRLCEATWRLHEQCDPHSAERIRQSLRPAELPPAADTQAAELDLAFYGRFYKDLASLDDTTLADHWRLHGRIEGRVANFEAFLADRAGRGLVLPTDFSAAAYRRLNPDLLRICEHDWECVAHYLDIGAIEHRPYDPSHMVRSPEAAAVAVPHPPAPRDRIDPPRIATRAASGRAAPPATDEKPPPSVWQGGDCETIGFLAGTRLNTVGGPVPIEALVEGELLVTASGAVVPILWVGKERYDARLHPRPDGLGPVRILVDALGSGLPKADLVLAPDQPILVEGVLVPAYALVNGATILSESTPELFACFHVELAAQGLLIAEGVAALSYPSDPSVGPMAAALAAVARPTIRFGAERGRPIAQPLVTSGAELARIRADLKDRAFALGHQLTSDPDLRLAVGAAILRAEPAPDNEWRFTLPAGVTTMRLLSRSSVGRWIWPDSADRRRLGVALARVRFINEGHPRDVPLDDLGPDGLHPAEQDDAARWRWTTGDALLKCPLTGEAAILAVTLHKTAACWLPRDTAARRSEAAVGVTGPVRSVVFVSGEPHTPGHVYRVLRPLAAASGLGLHTSWMPTHEIAGRLDEIAGADLVVVWRAPMGPALWPVIETARATGAYLLFDVDDLMVDPDLARREIIDAIRLNAYDERQVRDLYDRTRKMAIACDGCLTTTEELAVHLRDLNRPVWVLPNGFDAETLRRSRQAVRQRQLAAPDGLFRIGYAGGSRTHQRDFAPLAKALGRLLAEHPEARLVLFREKQGGLDLVEVDEFPALAARQDQIEWRDMVPLADLPDELARFDVSVAPLEVGNLFCEAKSELKFFEAALAGVCTVATPTGPFRRAIRDNETGFFATDPDEWYAVLKRLIGDASLRAAVAVAAYHDCLRRFGPEQRADQLAATLVQLRTGRDAARAFELETRRALAAKPQPIVVPRGELLYLRDRLGDAQATVIIPLYNYIAYIGEALDSVWHQTLSAVDLVVVDDQSSDDSVAFTHNWMQENGGRFNRVVLIRNESNSGLAFTRNAGFAAAETRYVLPLDADNRLFPRCLAACLQATEANPGAAFVYPRIQQFGMTAELMGNEPYTAMQLAAGNYIDAMALVDKSAWAAVGGYDHIHFGWEDFDLWCRMAEHGMWGCQADGVLAEYRVHGSSMLRTITDIVRNKQRLIDDMQARHPWLAVSALHALADQKKAIAAKFRPQLREPQPIEPAPEPHRAKRRVSRRLNGAAGKATRAGSSRSTV